jgi:hypothetical protein
MKMRATKMQICVTYTITSNESATIGDYDEVGFIIEKTYNGSLRDCIKALFSTRTNAVDGIECIHGYYQEYDLRLILTVFNGTEFETGDCESRTLHLSGITQSSAKRLAKILNVRLDRSW